MIALADLELREPGGVAGALRRLGDRLSLRLQSALEVLSERWRGSVSVSDLARAVERRDVARAEAIAVEPILMTDPGELVEVQRRLFRSEARQQAFTEAGELTGRAAPLLRPHVPGLSAPLREAATRSEPSPEVRQGGEIVA